LRIISRSCSTRNHSSAGITSKQPALFETTATNNHLSIDPESEEQPGFRGVDFAGRHVSEEH
jgi:hypothetical protein